MSLFAPPDDPRRPVPEPSEPAAREADDVLADAVQAEPEGPSPIDPDDAFVPAARVEASPIDYVVPTTQPRTARPTPPRRRGTALIATGALALGLAGGVGGSIAWDTFGPSDAILPTVPDVERTAEDFTVVSTVAQAVMPSVVQIESLTGGLATSTGSGLVIREDGYILTNNHVIESSDGEVSVLFSDGEVITGSIVGGSPEYDLAVIKVERDGLTPLVLGDSDALVVGDPVIAIGSPLGLDSTVTTGIVSALNRPVLTGDGAATAYIAAVQTDAAINPGNSGGPLLNHDGEVIGINSAIAALPGATQATGAGSVGLGFAIPSSQARRIAEELIEDGTADVPVIGVLLDSTYQGQGVKVADSADLDGQPGVIPGTPADLAGIREGDVIVGVNGVTVADPDTAIVLIRAKAPGETVTFTLERDGERRDVDVLLVAYDDVDFGDAVPAEDGTE